MKRKLAGSSSSLSDEKAEICGGCAKQNRSPTAMREITMGVVKAIAYHRIPTRQRTSRLKNSRTPGRPDVSALMIIPATNGPSGLGPLVRPRANAMIHGYQESTKAITKNAIRQCCFKKALTSFLGD